jgi:hypothetical protein
VPKNKALAVNELPILVRQGHSREGNFIPIYAKKQVKHRVPAVISAGSQPAVPRNHPHSGNTSRRCRQFLNFVPHDL